MTTISIIADMEEFDEIVVEVRVDGIVNEKRCYFTDDLEDAKGTAKLMAKEARDLGEEVP